MRIFYLVSSLAIVSGSFVFSSPAFATTGCNAAGWDLNFSDVTGCTSSYPAINFLVEKNIVQGYADKTFKPNQPINRAEFTKILIGTKSTEAERLECLGAISLFPDVAKNTWYAPYVCIAKQRKIVDGYDDGTFRPGQQINYAEAAKIAANAYGLFIPPKDSDDPRWYSPYAHALVEKNATPPTVNQYDDPFTRGEMSELIYRLETGKTSLEWFAAIQDGDEVFSHEVSGSPTGVSFSFPGSLFSAKPGTLFFYDIFLSKNRTYPALELTHVYQGEGCNGMAGYDAPCRPAGSEISFAIGMVDRPLEYIKLGFGDIAEMDTAPITIDGREGFTYWQGVECEGVEYTVVPANASATLVIMRGFDCNDGNREPGFLSSDTQKELVKAFLASIHFETPAAAQNAPTIQVTLLMCENTVPYNPGENDPTINVAYTIPKTTLVADSMLRLLFRSYGKGIARQCDGLSSLGSFYTGVTLSNGVATVKLSKPMREIFSDDSRFGLQYRDSAIKSVEENLKQFPTVKSVVFSDE